MRYAIHSHFSGDEMASLLRVEILVPPAAAPLLEWCRRAPRRFSARKAWRGAQDLAASRGEGSRLRFEHAAAVLAALEEHGFCRRATPRALPSNDEGKRKGRGPGLRPLIEQA